MRSLAPAADAWRGFVSTWGLTDSPGALRRSWESEEQVEKAEKRSLTGKESGDQLKVGSEGTPACHHQDFPMGSFI